MKIMHAIYLSLIFIVLYTNSALSSNEYYIYQDKNIVSYSARFNVDKPIRIKRIKLWLSGSNSHGGARLRIFGDEGGSPVPYYEKDLITPIIVHKTHDGIEEISIDIKEELNIDKSQYFVTLDHLDSNVYWATNKTKMRPTCVSPIYGNYTRQSLKDVSNKWYTSDYSFAINISSDDLVSSKDTYFQRITPTLDTSSLRNNVCINVFDYDLDGYMDILYKGKLYKNYGKMNFKEIGKSLNLSLKDSLITGHIVIDVNNDGRSDMLFFHLPDSLKRSVTLYERKDQDYMNKELDISLIDTILSYCVSDLNGDGYNDVLLISKDSLSHVNILLNNKYSGYKEDNFIDFQKANYVLCRIFDVNNDGRNDIVLLDDTGIEYVYINRGGTNFTFESGYQENPKDILRINNIKYADIDGDGKSDKIELLSKKLDGIPQSNNGILINGNEIIPNRYFNEVQSGVLICDFNNDGRNDIVLTTGCLCRSSDFYISNPNGGYTIKNYTSGFFKNSLGTDVGSVDFDNDGSVDFFTLENNNLIIYKNTYDKVEVAGNYLTLHYNDKDNLDRVIVYSGNNVTVKNILAHEIGVLTEVSNVLHIGLNGSNAIDSMKLVSKDNVLYSTDNVKINDEYIVNLDSLHRSYNLVESVASPNPFLVYTNVSIIVNKSDEYALSIQTLDGRIIRHYSLGILNGGTHVIRWDGKDGDGQDVPSGAYIYRISNSITNIVNKIIKL